MSDGKVDAYEFGHQMRPGSVFVFGVGRDESAQALRELADRIQKGEVAIDNVRVTQLASHGGFAVTVLRLVLHEHHKP